MGSPIFGIIIDSSKRRTSTPPTRALRITSAPRSSGFTVRIVRGAVSVGTAFMPQKDWTPCIKW